MANSAMRWQRTPHPGSRHRRRVVRPRPPPPSTIKSKWYTTGSARSITGIRIRDRVSVPDLLERGGIPGMNAMVINAVATETWNCKHSSDGGNGAKNFVGAVIFDTGEAVKATRATLAGMATIPLRGRDTFVSNGARTWNASEALREATTKPAARLAAKNLAARAPVSHWRRRQTRPTWQRRSPTRHGE
jgi:hypothetical protein